MSTIDQFESAFRSAYRTHYQPRSFPIRNVMVLTDLDDPQDQKFLEGVDRFFSEMSLRPKLTLIPTKTSSNIDSLLTLLNDHSPDLVCTYRNLHTAYGQYPYTLGDHVEVLTQVTQVPILLVPRPEKLIDQPLTPPQKVIALTDQLTTHPELVDAALSMLAHSGHLILSHVEDDQLFERYAQAISKIPTIDTESATQAIKDQLLKEAHDFIMSCQQSIQNHAEQIQVHSEVLFGHQIQAYKALVDQYQVDLLVMQTKDDDQIAMHGLSYPLAIELKDLPLLLL